MNLWESGLFGAAFCGSWGFGDGMLDGEECQVRWCLCMNALLYVAHENWGKGEMERLTKRHLIMHFFDLFFYASVFVSMSSKETAFHF